MTKLPGEKRTNIDPFGAGRGPLRPPKWSFGTKVGLFECHRGLSHDIAVTQRVGPTRGGPIGGCWNQI